MRPSDRYHKWVEWSEEDHAYLGKCPDLITGIHGDDPVQLYRELCDVVDEVIQHFETEGRALPPSRIRPMAAASALAPTQIHQAAEIREDVATYDEPPEDGFPPRSGG